MDSIILLWEFLTDMVFIVKIFALLAIIGFINANVQSKIIKIIVTFFMVYFVLIANWQTFGTLWIIYMILGMGISSMIVDYFFMTQHPEEEMDAQMGLQQHEQHGHPLHRGGFQ